MAKKFSDFVNEFNTFKEQNNLKIEFNDSRGYFWRLGDPAKDLFQPTYEQQVKDAKPEEVAGFRAMFVEGSEMLGIPTGKSLGNFNGVKLYKMSEVDQSFAVNNLLFSYNAVMLSGDIGTTVTSPDTGEVFNKPMIIKPESLHMSGGFDGVDVIASRTSGLIYGEGFKNQLRNNNRLGKESIMGTLDYSTGKINLLRSNEDNDALAPIYEAFVTGLTLAPPPAPTGGEGGDTGGGTEPSVPMYTSSTPPPTETLNKVILNCTYKVYDNPVTIVWEFSL